jgi:uncharacterized protein
MRTGIVGHTNPFRYGALALDEAFTDREAELRELKADVLNGQDLVIFGRRRFGKSSLVLTAAQDLIAEKVLVAYCDLMTAPTKARFAEKLVKTIHEDIASPLFRIREKAIAVFRGLRVQPKITIDPDDGSLSFGFDAAYAPADIDATIEKLLALPGELGADRGRRVALVLDEFQEITAIDPTFPKLMRAVFQTQPEVAHVYLGSKRHLMRRIFNDENEPFWRSAKQMELGPIAADHFAAYVVERFEKTAKAIGDPAVARLLGATGGHPYATQQLSYFVWEEVAEREEATVEHVERGLERLVTSEHNHFSLVWEDASRNERLLLLALAEESGRVFSGEYRREHRLPAPTNVQKSLAALVRRELVGKGEDGRYHIIEPFLADWVARTQLASRGVRDFGG